MQFLEKPWKRGENIYYQKLFSIRTKLSYWKFFHRKLLMNKVVYLGLSILDLSKTVMYEFWRYYVKPEYDKYAKRCYMNTVSFTAYIKIDDIYKDIAEDVEAGFDT